MILTILSFFHFLYHFSINIIIVFVVTKCTFIFSSILSLNLYSPNGYSCVSLFPTCQVRVVRFYHSCSPPPSSSSSSYLSLSGLGIVELEVEEKLGELAGRAGMVGVGGLAGW